MSQLIVRQIEEQVVKKLKARAGSHGVSMEEEHRRILRQALLGKTGPRSSLKRYLLQMPGGGPDNLFDRKPETGRKIEL